MVAAIRLGGGPTFAAPATADVGCSEDKACVARGTGGAAAPYAYQFAVADSSLSTNYYDNAVARQRSTR
jgi:hypothetical protein